MKDNAWILLLILLDPPPKNLSHISYNDETWDNYSLPKEDTKIYESRDTHLQFCFNSTQN